LIEGGGGGDDDDDDDDDLHKKDSIPWRYHNTDISLVYRLQHNYYAYITNYTYALLACHLCVIH
jgi:hypothetical protein